MKTRLDIIYRVVDEDEGASLYLELESGFVCISAPDVVSKQFFGDLELNIKKEFAKALGLALIKAAEE